MTAKSPKPKQKNLTDKQRGFIVSCYATFMQTREVQAAFQEKFGRDLNATSAKFYNPALKREGMGHNPFPQKWLEVFNRTREDYLAKVSEVPVANARYRLEKLNTMFHHYYDKKAYMPAAKLLEQAAREVNGTSWQQENIAKNTHATGDQSDDAPDIVPAVKDAMLGGAIRDAISMVLSSQALAAKANAAGSDAYN